MDYFHFTRAPSASVRLTNCWRLARWRGFLVKLDVALVSLRGSVRLRIGRHSSKLSPVQWEDGRNILHFRLATENAVRVFTHKLNKTVFAHINATFSAHFDDVMFFCPQQNNTAAVDIHDGNIIRIGTTINYNNRILYYACNNILWVVDPYAINTHNMQCSYKRV